MDLIQEGLKRDLVQFDSKGKYVSYRQQQKRRNYEDPEEKVQTDTYLKLVLVYGYPAERVEHFVPVQMGSETKEADLIVYDDEAKKSPLIIVECKKPEVSEMEFARAVDQAFSYAVSEGAKYVWVTSSLKNEYYEVTTERPKNRLVIPDVPQFGVKELAKYKFSKGGGETKTGQKLFDLQTVAEDELTRRFQLAHQALWGGGELNPSEAFDELDKLIFCKLWDERKPRKKGEPYDFQILTEDTREKTDRGLLERIRALYEEGRKKDAEVFKDDIRLNASKVRTVVSYLESVNLSDTDLDSKGRAFETFMGSFFRGDFGQYFTPRPIVKFVVDVLPITHQSLVLDTSCGSGGFLLHALEKVRKEADRFYLDQVGPMEGAKHYKHWHDFAMSNLFGVEINEQIARTAKMNMIIYKIIEAVCQDLNEKNPVGPKLRVERVDWFVDGTSYEIQDKIVDMIAGCGYFIGNLTFCNPNVYHEIGLVMGKAKAEGNNTANMLLFLDQSVPEDKDKAVAFNLQGIKQLRFTQSEDFRKDLRLNLQKFFTLN